MSGTVTEQLQALVARWRSKARLERVGADGDSMAGGMRMEAVADAVDRCANQLDAVVTEMVKVATPPKPGGCPWRRVDGFPCLGPANHPEHHSIYPEQWLVPAPSARDQRRLALGAAALAMPEPTTEAEARAQFEQLKEALAAMQSLDDLGRIANEKAMQDHDILMAKFERLKTLRGR